LKEFQKISLAHVSLESEIIRYIKYHVNPETDKIKIKISGDRSKVTKISYHHPSKYLNQKVSP
jgi:hypothetical protein